MRYFRASLLANSCAFERQATQTVSFRQDSISWNQDSSSIQLGTEDDAWFDCAEVAPQKQRYFVNKLRVGPFRCLSFAILHTQLINRLTFALLGKELEARREVLDIARPEIFPCNQQQHQTHRKWLQFLGNLSWSHWYGKYFSSSHMLLVPLSYAVWLKNSQLW